MGVVSTDYHYSISCSGRAGEEHTPRRLADVWVRIVLSGGGLPVREAILTEARGHRRSSAEPMEAIWTVRDLSCPKCRGSYRLTPSFATDDRLEILATELGGVIDVRLLRAASR